MKQKQSGFPPPRIPAYPAERTLPAAPIALDPKRHLVSVRGKTIRLTSREFALLEPLVEAKGAVVSREHLLERGWGSEQVTEIESRTVNVHIHRLRRKLRAAGVEIITVKSVGYRLDIAFEWIKFGT